MHVHPCVWFPSVYLPLHFPLEKKFSWYSSQFNSNFLVLQFSEFAQTILESQLNGCLKQTFTHHQMTLSLALTEIGFCMIFVMELEWTSSKNCQLTNSMPTRESCSFLSQGFPMEMIDFALSLSQSCCGSQVNKGGAMQNEKYYKNLRYYH